jgi:hypothetical protein
LRRQAAHTAQPVISSHFAAKYPRVFWSFCWVFSGHCRGLVFAVFGTTTPRLVFFSQQIPTTRQSCSQLSRKKTMSEEPLSEQPEDFDAMFDLGAKKKKKKKATTKTTDTVVEEVSPVATCEASVSVIDSSSTAAPVATSSDCESTIPTYAYIELLQRVLGFVEINNPDLIDKKRFTMKPPQLMRGMMDSL